MIYFPQRNRAAELMDDPIVDLESMQKVFKDINRSNRLLNGNYITIGAVSKLIRENQKKEYTLIDMGCGDGAMLRQLILYGRKNNLKIKAVGVDLNEKALQIARNQSEDFPEIRYLQQNILQKETSDLHCDILVCTLTVHHFKDEQIPDFLSRFVQLARIGVVINDLQRSMLAYALFKVFSVIFIHTKMAKHDGLISIKSGFKKKELIDFSKNLPSADHSIHWKWAFRYVWIMRIRRLS